MPCARMCVRFNFRMISPIAPVAPGARSVARATFTIVRASGRRTRRHSRRRPVSHRLHGLIRPKSSPTWWRIATRTRNRSAFLGNSTSRSPSSITCSAWSTSRACASRAPVPWSTTAPCTFWAVRQTQWMRLNCSRYTLYASSYILKWNFQGQRLRRPAVCDAQLPHEWV